MKDKVHDAVFHKVGQKKKKGRRIIHSNLHSKEISEECVKEKT